MAVSAFAAASAAIALGGVRLLTALTHEFGRKAGMNPTYLGFLDRGESTPPLTCVLHLAKVFGVEAWTIVAEIEGA
jgi:hypothetical protein